VLGSSYTALHRQVGTTEKRDGVGTGRFATVSKER
jgi:hypothetical protein